MERGVVRNAVALARPHHWIKNIIVLAPLPLAKRMGDPEAWANAALALFAFCFASSAAYVVNDIVDRERDRRHPGKSSRPLASGRMSVRAALVEAVVLLGLTAAVAVNLRWTAWAIVLAYVLLQFAYSAFLKGAILLDVICIALGFVLRPAAGAVAIGVEVSPWLFVCTFSLCMFMGFCKRRNELATIGDATEGEEHRRTLGGYTPEVLTHLVTLSAAVAVASFLSYASAQRTVELFGTVYLIYMLPLIVYAIFRFAMLSIRGVYEDPTDLILHDRPFQATALLWVGVTLAVLRWGRHLQVWLQGLP